MAKRKKKTRRKKVGMEARKKERTLAVMLEVLAAPLEALAKGKCMHRFI